jgi:hypothetical protein
MFPDSINGMHGDPIPGQSPPPLESFIEDSKRPFFRKLAEGRNYLIYDEGHGSYKYDVVFGEEDKHGRRHKVAERSAIENSAHIDQAGDYWTVNQIWKDEKTVMTDIYSDPDDKYTLASVTHESGLLHNVLLGHIFKKFRPQAQPQLSPMVKIVHNNLIMGDVKDALRDSQGRPLIENSSYYFDVDNFTAAQPQGAENKGWELQIINSTEEGARIPFPNKGIVTNPTLGMTYAIEFNVKADVDPDTKIESRYLEVAQKNLKTGQIKIVHAPIWLDLAKAEKVFFSPAVVKNDRGIETFPWRDISTVVGVGLQEIQPHQELLERLRRFSKMPIDEEE